MAQGINSCTFIGNLTKDAESRLTESQMPVCDFTVACSRKYKDKEETEFVRCVTFGKLAEICGEYLKKGKQIYVNGFMQTQKYEKDGIDVYSTKIVCNDMKMLGNKEPQQGGFGQAHKAIDANEQLPENDIPF
jgi:single-strand DNA-binding protein